MRKIICVVCPRGCNITVEGEGSRIDSIEGYGCNRGIDYATSEFICPCRILTTSVRLEGTGRKMLPVRSSSPIPLHMLSACVELIRQKTARTPVRMHQVILADIMGTGADMISSMSIE